MVSRAALGRLQYTTALRPRYVSLTNKTLQRALSSSILDQPKVSTKVRPVFGMSKMEYSKLAVPDWCLCDFCLLPLGTGSASVSTEVAEIQKLVKSSGLNYTLHSAGTTIEGSWDEVMSLVGKAHTLIHETGAARIQTDMRVGTRTDKKQPFADKVTKVEEILSKETQG